MAKRTTVVDEKLLSERVNYGHKTHLYVAYLRAFKLGEFQEIGIKTIADIAKQLYASRLLIKHSGKEHTPLKYSTILTELEKIWAVIKLEDTTQIDPYGYDVIIIH